MENIDPIQAARERHQRRVEREQLDVNEYRLDVLSEHAAEISTRTKRERFKVAFKKLGNCLSVLGEALIAEQRSSPYANDGYIHGSFVSTLSPMPLQPLADHVSRGDAIKARNSQEHAKPTKPSWTDEGEWSEYQATL